MYQSCFNSKVAKSKSPPVHLDQNHIKSISNLNDSVIYQALGDQDYSTCLSLLNQLEHTIKNNNYGTYTSSKKHYYYHLYICYYNIALVHQHRNDNSAAKNNLEKAINSYQKMQGFITQREENLIFMGEIAKTQLQYCGLLSHCDMHQQAVILAEKSLDKIIQASRILQAVCYEQMILNSQRDTTCSSRERGNRVQMVNFKKTVIDQAEIMLLELTHMSPAHKIVTDDKNYFEKIISKISAWKENQANNQNAIRKELKVPSERSSRNLLGIQKQVIQKQFQIGSLMSLTFKQICYKPHADPLRLLSAHYLRQLAFHSAVAYFTVATQSRFSQSDLNELRGNMKIDQKYKKLNHDERILKCKILHLKGLEIAGKLLPAGNALFGHLAQSFCRNYKFVMDQINEVSQMNSTHAVEKEKENANKNQTSLTSEYGFKVVSKDPKKREKSKHEKSKNKLNKPRESRRSTSTTKNRSTSNLKKIKQ